MSVMDIQERLEKDPLLFNIAEMQLQIKDTTEHLSTWVGHIDDYLVDESIRTEKIEKDIALVRFLCGFVVLGSLLLWGL